MILGFQTTSGDWLSSSHTPNCQSEPGIPECELYNVNMPASLLAVYLYQLLSCPLLKNAMASGTMHISYRSFSKNISAQRTFICCFCVVAYAVPYLEWLAWERLIVTCSYVLFGLKITFLSYLKLKVFRTGREKNTSIPLVCLLMNPFLTCRTFLFLILSNSFLVHALWHSHYLSLPSAGDKWRQLFPQCGGLLEITKAKFLLETPSASLTGQVSVRY